MDIECTGTVVWTWKAFSRTHSLTNVGMWIRQAAKKEGSKEGWVVT